MFEPAPERVARRAAAAEASFVPTSSRQLLAALAATAIAAALPAPASASSSPGPATCPATPVTQPFAPWGDEADYFLAPDGGFEGAGWALSGGAEVVAGNEPFRVAGRWDRRALRLPDGGVATSAPFCVGPEHRTMRFFTRSTAASTLDVDVLYADADGVARSQRIATLAGAGGWAPSDIVPMLVDALAAERGGTLTARLRFTSTGRGTRAIDDVHVDPFRSR